METYIFSRTIPLAMHAPPKGFAFKAVTLWDFTYGPFAHRCDLR